VIPRDSNISTRLSFLAWSIRVCSIIRFLSFSVRALAR